MASASWPSRGPTGSSATPPRCAPSFTTMCRKQADNSTWSKRAPAASRTHATLWASTAPSVPAHRPDLGPCWLWTGAGGERLLGADVPQDGGKGESRAGRGGALPGGEDDAGGAPAGLDGAGAAPRCAGRPRRPCRPPGSGRRGGRRRRRGPRSRTRGRSPGAARCPGGGRGGRARWTTRVGRRARQGRRPRRGRSRGRRPRRSPEPGPGGERDRGLGGEGERVAPADHPAVGQVGLGVRVASGLPALWKPSTPYRRWPAAPGPGASRSGPGSPASARLRDARRRWPGRGRAGARPRAPARRASQGVGAPEAEVRGGAPRAVAEGQADDRLAGPAGGEGRLDRPAGDVEQRQAAGRPGARRGAARGRRCGDDAVRQRGAARPSPARMAPVARASRGTGALPRRPCLAGAGATRVRVPAPPAARTSRRPPGPVAICQGAGPAGRGVPMARPVAPSRRVIVPSKLLAT